MNYLDNVYIREEIDEVVSDYARLNNLDSGIIVDQMSGAQFLACLVNYEDLSNGGTCEVIMGFEIEKAVCERMQYAIYSGGLRDECEEFEYETPKLIEVRRVS